MKSRTASGKKHGNRGRDGRVGRGNTLHAGDPGKNQFDYRNAFKEAITKDQIASVFRVLLKQAMKGDVKAAKELLDRGLGRPAIPIALPADIERLAADARDYLKTYFEGDLK